MTTEKRIMITEKTNKESNNNNREDNINNREKKLRWIKNNSWLLWNYDFTAGQSKRKLESKNTR